MQFLFSSSRTWREWPNHWHSLLYPSHLKLQERASNHPGYLSCIWYDLASKLGLLSARCRELGSKNSQHRAGLFRAHCSFVGIGEVTIGGLFLDGYNEEARWFPFTSPGKECRLCFLPPGLLLTGPGLQVSQPTLCDSAPSFVIGLLRWIQGLWGMSKEAFENAGSCRMTGYSLCFGNWHTGWGMSPSWVAVCGFLRSKEFPDLVLFLLGPGPHLPAAITRKLYHVLSLFWPPSISHIKSLLHVSKDLNRWFTSKEMQEVKHTE